MRVLLRKILAKSLDERRKAALKRIEFKSRKALSRLAPRLRHYDFLQLLRNEFGLRAGDVVMVHASATMLNTSLTPREILDIVAGVITPSGTIVVPASPPASSIEFMKRRQTFDARTTRSGMGAISEALRKTPGALRSTHPTKSVAALGPDAEEICAGHERCLYPFGAGSPYEKLLAKSAKIIGIGVPPSYLSFVHVAEDLFPERTTLPIWDPGIYEKTCIDMHGQSHNVRTKVHNMALMSQADPGKFCSRHLARGQFIKCRRWLTEFFAVDAQVLTSSLLKGLERDLTIYD